MNHFKKRCSCFPKYQAGRTRCSVVQSCADVPYCHQEVRDNPATEIFLKPFLDKSVCFCFLPNLLRRSAPFRWLFRGGEFRVRRSRFDAIADPTEEFFCEFTKTDSNLFFFLQMICFQNDLQPPICGFCCDVTDSRNGKL